MSLHLNPLKNQPWASQKWGSFQQVINFTANKWKDPQKWYWAGQQHTYCMTPYARLDVGGKTWWGILSMNYCPNTLIIPTAQGVALAQLSLTQHNSCKPLVGDKYQPSAVHPSSVHVTNEQGIPHINSWAHRFAMRVPGRTCCCWHSIAHEQSEGAG